MNTQNQKIKDLMEKQKLDEKTRKTYGVSVTLESNLIPNWTETSSNTCSFYGCSGKHVTTKAKGCKYHGCKNDGELNDRVQAYLEETYIAHYGECF